MIHPVLRDDMLLADVHATRDAKDSFRLWWLGQSGYLLQYNGHHVLLDPYLSDSLTTKYAGTDKPHVRMTSRIVAPERFDFVDAVTSTHNHTDHLDADTLGPLLHVNADIRLVIPEANRQFVADRLAIDAALPLGVDDGTSATVGDFVFHGVPAAHEAVDRDDQGRCLYLGYVVQFGPWTVYHSGDTVRYDGMAERLRNRPIDVAILPINGRAPERGVPGNLDGAEAATLARDIGARIVIPCHYDMFEFNTASPDAFIAECQRVGQLCRVLQCGQRWSSSQLPNPGADAGEEA